MPESGVAPGLCSVTYRHLSPVEVVRLAAAAGLRTVEWGGDVHAPPGEPVRLREVRAATLDHGLTVASYGSYFRAGPHRAADFGPVLDAALALGAPRIRIWAGTLGSREADTAARREVVTQARDAARMAQRQGVQVGFEFHGGTLTDTVDSTLRLLDDVAEPNLATYWQPPVGMPDDEAVDGLVRLGERVCALHVFSWWPDTRRLPLASRHELWRRVFQVARRHATTPGRHGTGMDALLEFVPDDDPDLLPGEAAALRDLSEATAA